MQYMRQHAPLITTANTKCYKVLPKLLPFDHKYMCLLLIHYPKNWRFPPLLNLHSKIVQNPDNFKGSLVANIFGELEVKKKNAASLNAAF